MTVEANETYVPCNVLITGGCGFIGSNFVNYIFEKWPHARLVNVDKLILNADANYVAAHIRNSDRYNLVLSDISNSQVIDAVLDEYEIDTVVNIAADCTSVRCYGNPVEATENNSVAPLELLESVRRQRNGRVRRFLHVSTDEVYGDSAFGDEERPKAEHERPKPGNPYAATKAACEAFVQFYQKAYNLPIVIVRINNVFGPNQWAIKLVPRFIEAARRGEKFPVQGSGDQLRSWLFADDASEGIQRATESGVVGEIYNLGTYVEKSVREIAEIVKNEVDVQLGREPSPPVFDPIPDRPYNDQRYLIDIGKAKAELGWAPSTPFNQGIKKVVTSHLSSAAQPPKTMRMKVAVYGGRGWVGQQVQRILDASGTPFELATCKLGVNTKDEIIAELNRIRPTHVLCCTGRTHGGSFKTIEYLEGGPERDFENIRDNLYCPLALACWCAQLRLHYTYVGTGYLFAYDRGAHTVGGLGFTEKNLPTFFGNSYSVVKGFTDRMLNTLAFDDCVNARITLPLNFELNEERNLLSKIITYKQIFDIPVSITILPDCLPILFELMEKRFSGPLNLVNPQPISLHTILELYKENYDEKLPDHEAITMESEKGRQLMDTKGNCALATNQLEKVVNKLLGKQIPSAHNSLVENFRRMRSKLP